MKLNNKKARIQMNFFKIKIKVEKLQVQMKMKKKALMMIF